MPDEINYEELNTQLDSIAEQMGIKFDEEGNELVEEGTPSLLDDSGAPTEGADDASSDGQGTDPTGDGKSGDENYGEDPGKFQVLDGLAQAAVESNMTLEQAQKMSSTFQAMSEQAQAQQQQEWSTLQTQWQEITRADSEVGGANLEASLSNARSAINTFGSAELMGLLNESGWGNHVEFIRMLSRIGKAVKEDKFVFGNSAPQPSRDPAKVMFPDMA